MYVHSENELKINNFDKIYYSFKRIENDKAQTPLSYLSA